MLFTILQSMIFNLSILYKSYSTYGNKIEQMVKHMVQWRKLRREQG